MVLFAFLGRRTGGSHDFRKVETDLLFDDFRQGHVCRTHAGRSIHQWAAHAASANVQLADPAGNDVDEYVGITNFFQGFFGQV